MSRIAYFGRRLLLAIPTFIGITLVCFALTRFLPGGPVETRLLRMRGLAAQGEAVVGAAGGGVAVTAEHRKALAAQFGFDRSLPVQYWDWLVTNRMGLRLASYDHPAQTAGQLILARLPVSLGFGLVAFLLTYAICIPLGVAKALRHRHAFDTASSAVVFAAYAIPPFALALCLKACLCGTTEGLWDLFPLGGLASDFDVAPSWWVALADRAAHMALPVLCYVAGSFAMLTLLMKNSILEQISADYVRTVIAKGATRRRAIWAHAFRNALVPVATSVRPMFAGLLAGSIVIETVFEIPGLGRLGWDALVGRDYAVFLALLALTAILQLLGNLVSDALYLLIDPRIDYERK